LFPAGSYPGKAQQQAAGTSSNKLQHALADHTKRST
jgi:hypothetical protein